LARAREEFRSGLEQQTAQTERQTAQVQSQQEAVLNSMVEGLLLLDEQGRIQLANRAFATLFEVGADIRGKTVLEALRLHELSTLVQRLPREGQVLAHELRLTRGQERWIEVNAAALPGRNGARPGAILVFHDLTRLKKLERTREEFVANVSHELRTPLSLIKGYTETLLEGAKDNPQVSARFLQSIDRNAERLKLLIEDLLTISALESGRVRLDLRPVLLPALVEKVLNDFRRRAGGKGIKLVDESPALTVRADAGRLEQVFFNLVDNAIKYGKPEGQVTVGARIVDGEQIEAFVRDDGPGIPPAAIERVFERFYRVDKARSREQGGTGLGLSIVKHIVQSHGGRVWVESSLGQGATFFFTLPRERQRELVL
jgi:two-component system phosphate regulon sensor histidine kinase PhoR